MDKLETKEETVFTKADPPIYEIRPKESLSHDQWEWLEGLQLVNQPDGTTLLTGQVVDQAALLGLLNKISALGLTLVSLNRIGGCSKLVRLEP
jgi:hypothetical protein